MYLTALVPPFPSFSPSLPPSSHPNKAPISPSPPSLLPSLPPSSSGNGVCPGHPVRRVRR